MPTFKVPNMSCGHCAGAVTKAVQTLDAGARVEIDLKTQTIAVESKVEPGRIAAAIEQAGYPVAAA